MAETVENGNTVVVEYTGKLEDQTVFDTSKGKTPLEFRAGTRQVIKGFDEAVVGMKKGEEKTFTIHPDDAYGQVNENLVKKVPRTAFPKDLQIKEGVGLKLQGPEKEVLLAKVVTLDDKEVTIDLNHPLAGKTLKFEIKLIDIRV